MPERTCPPHTLRWPSPRNGEAARSARMAANRSASETSGFSPRRTGCSGPHLWMLPRTAGRSSSNAGTPHPANPFQTLAFAGALRGRQAHRDDLLQPKGRRASLSLRRISTSFTSLPMRRSASSNRASRVPRDRHRCRPAHD
ncbi:hypothetical protein MCA2393 [Methylococcus capsulatus str. Bath]|uniref:Uncharacterized protein n=1 Tax=Methylococcus capsulatus (strain ATCC 33009 / NCIMB 11132 / Bath) TaxID=243233 RepID=Q604Z2_METCA|nr:hypothetical protein MCA2393 [Methylococcus capsulatus str. Bath]